MLLLNILAAVTFVLLAAAATQAQRTHAYSTFREFEIHRALVEKPTYSNGEPLNVEARLLAIGGGGRYYSFLGYLGAGVCLLNGFVFFWSHARRRPENTA